MKAILAFAIAFMSTCEANAMSGRGTVCANNPNALAAETCLRTALASAETAMKEKLHAVSASARLHGTPAEEELAHSQDIWWQYVRETCEGLVKYASADEPIGSVDVLSCRVE